MTKKMDEELQKAIALLESNGYVVTKPMMNEMTSQMGFKRGVVYKVKQGRKSYDAVFLSGANGRASFILGDNDLDSAYPFTVNGKPMVIVSARECVNPRTIVKWTKVTGRNETDYERIVFKIPEESINKVK